jgi:ABC-type Fe3+ transport system permease subunit
MSLSLLESVIGTLSPPAPTPAVLWIRVERPSFDLWGVIVTSAEFVLLSIALALLLGAVLGWLLIRRGRPGTEPGSAGLGLRARLPGVDDRVGPELS